MKKQIIMCMFALCAVASWANGSTGPIDQKQRIAEERLLAPIKPTYLDGVVATSGWGSNWFIEVKDGASAFLGSPIGCGDVFDRTMPVLQVGLGKWFTPAVGGRVAYQGLQFKNANLQTMDYQFVHADFLYNLTHNLQQNEYGLSKLDVIPFVGVGMVRNASSPTGYLQTDGASSGNHPFAFSYGIELRYLIADRLHLVGEISGMTTLKNFDGVGNSCAFGDHMVSASVGLSYTIGKRGWKHVIDARPYISQNNYLLDRYAELSQYAKDRQRKETVNPMDKNDYSGLNSLRSRMSLGYGSGSQETLHDTLTQQTVGVGVPIYFYFKLNTAKLVDKSQLANLDEIARIAKEQHLAIHISGAADKATGTDKRNHTLSIERAKYIGKQLLKRGIPKDQIHATSQGGISQFTPKEANRFCVVILTE